MATVKFSKVTKAQAIEVLGNSSKLPDKAKQERSKALAREQLLQRKALEAANPELRELRLAQEKAKRKAKKVDSFEVDLLKAFSDLEKKGEVSVTEHKVKGRKALKPATITDKARLVRFKNLPYGKLQVTSRMVAGKPEYTTKFKLYNEVADDNSATEKKNGHDIIQLARAVRTKDLFWLGSEKISTYYKGSNLQHALQAFDLCLSKLGRKERPTRQQIKAILPSTTTMIQIISKVDNVEKLPSRKGDVTSKSSKKQLYPYEVR